MNVLSDVVGETHRLHRRIKIEPYAVKGKQLWYAHTVTVYWTVDKPKKFAIRVFGQTAKKGEDTWKEYTRSNCPKWVTELLKTSLPKRAAYGPSRNGKR